MSKEIINRYKKNIKGIEDIENSEILRVNLYEIIMKLEQKIEDLETRLKKLEESRI